MKTKLNKAGAEVLEMAKKFRQAAGYGAPNMLDKLEQGVAAIAKQYGYTVKELEAEAQRLSKQ